MLKILKMSNKNNTQTSLPFDVSKKEIKKYVQQHWNITFARQKNVGVLAKKIMTNVMGQIKRDDSEFKPYYQLHVTDIVGNDSKDKNIYSKVKNAFDDLTDLKWLIEDIGKKSFNYRHLINTSHVKCGYDNGTITIALNPLLKDYFIELAHYSTYNLKWSMTFKSWYSMRLFEILSAFEDKPYWEVSIENFRKLMDCENKLPVTRDLIKSTTKKAMIELEPTNMAFTLEEIKDKSPISKGRKSIVALKFNLKKYKPKPNLEDWEKFSETHKKVLDRLRKYKVTDDNISKYSKKIGLKTIQKLLYEWDLKEYSNERIKNRLAYCNKVFVAMGKE